MTEAQKEFERIKFAYLIKKFGEPIGVDGEVAYRLKVPASEVFALAQKKVTMYPADEPPFISYVMVEEDK
jgi:hypothetical protein